MAQTLLSPALSDSVERSADPATSRAFLTRLLEDHPDLGDELATNALVRDALVALSAASRSLSAAVARDPSLLDLLRDGDGFERERELSGYRDAAATCLASSDDGRGALRRWKQRELLRIAARDLLGAADLPAVGRELAALAAVCLECALRLVAPDVPLAVIAMGKLGGRELNYASDVDVLFVHEGDGASAERAARAVLTTMSEPTADGIVFRTDADLRPEGRSGPLSRTLDAYAAYYARWAQPATPSSAGASPSSSGRSSGRRCSTPTPSARCGP
jgi:glutamate-ammonia-ligase adenylyltransferase